MCIKPLTLNHLYQAVNIKSLNGTSVTMKQFNALLQHPTMQAYAAHRLKTDALANMWQSVAPAALVKLAVASHITQKRLIVMCSSNAVAAKIKLLAPSLLIQLQNQGYEITAISAKVQVQSHPETLVKPNRKLSAQATKALKSLEATLQDTPLGNALANITRHAETDQTTH